MRMAIKEGTMCFEQRREIEELRKGDSELCFEDLVETKLRLVSSWEPLQGTSPAPAGPLLSLPLVPFLRST